MFPRLCFRLGIINKHVVHYLLCQSGCLMGRQDIQPNDIQPNDTQHNGLNIVIEHKNTQQQVLLC